jgi:hypothetical protein
MGRNVVVGYRIRDSTTVYCFTVLLAEVHPSPTVIIRHVLCVSSYPFGSPQLLPPTVY